MAKKILIVDDSLFMRSVLKDILSDYVICEAENGAQAEAQFAKEHPDLTLLDIIMPDGEEEGLRVLKSIKKKDHTAKVIMITAVGQATILKECQKIGALDYITKPFDHENIAKTVSRALD